MEVAEPTGSDAGAIIAAARAGSTGGGQGEEVASRNSSRYALSAIAGCASAMIMAIVKSNPDKMTRIIRMFSTCTQRSRFSRVRPSAPPARVSEWYRGLIICGTHRNYCGSC